LIKYIILLLLSNIITREEYEYYTAKIKKQTNINIPVVPVVPNSPVNSNELILYIPIRISKKKIINDDDDDNDSDDGSDDGDNIDKDEDDYNIDEDDDNIDEDDDNIDECPTNIMKSKKKKVNIRIGQFLFNNGIRGFTRKNNDIYIIKEDNSEERIDNNNIFKYFMVIEKNYSLRNFLEVLLKRNYINKIVLTDKGDSNMLFVNPSRYGGKTELTKTNPTQYYYTDFTDKSFAQICKDKSLSYKYLMDCTNCSDRSKYVPVTIMYVEYNKPALLNKVNELIFSKNKIAIFKPNKGSQGVGIRVVKSQNEMNNFLRENPNTIYTVSEFLFSAYTNWKNNIVKTVSNKSVTQTFNGHKVNIRPYVIIKITNNNNKFDSNTKKIIQIHNPPSKDNIKIEAFLHPNLISIYLKVK
jgi:hypothetical protein